MLWGYLRAPPSTWDGSAAGWCSLILPASRTAEFCPKCTERIVKGIEKVRGAPMRLSRLKGYSH